MGLSNLLMLDYRFCFVLFFCSCISLLFPYLFEAVPQSHLRGYFLDLSPP